MEEITDKDNQSGLRVFINGVPDLKLIPKEQADSILAVLERDISDYIAERFNKRID